jgi:hypothetical protein
MIEKSEEENNIRSSRYSSKYATFVISAAADDKETITGRSTFQRNYHQVLANITFYRTL